MRALPQALLPLAVVALAAGSAAEAATLSMPTPARTVVTPEFGERLDIRSTIVKRFSKGVIVVTRVDGGPLRLTSGPECTQDSASEVSCFLPSTEEFGPLRLEAKLGPLDDDFRFKGSGPEARGRYTVALDGGAGDDRLDVAVTTGGAILTAELIGGAGNDSLIAHSRGGFADAGDGDDVMVSHSSATFRSDMGAGNDTLTEQGAGAVVAGPGDDKIIGPGSVTIDGGDGNDDLWCGPACAGGAGDDKLRYGANQYGGPGNDRLLYALTSAHGDTCSGGWTTCSPGPDGVDHIEVADLDRQDGYSTVTRAQRVTCGGAQDSVIFDPRDDIGSDCETRTMKASNNQGA